MYQYLCWVVGIVLAFGLVSGSQAKGDGKLSRKDKFGNRRIRGGSEGTLSSEQKYAVEVLDQLHFRESDVASGSVKLAPIRKQTSAESLAGQADYTPGSPDLRVKGTHDDHPARIAIVRKDKVEYSRIAAWEDVKSASDSEDELGSNPTSKKRSSERKQRRFSESDGRVAKGRADDAAKNDQKNH